jgi:hypothetical protein
LQSGGYPTGLPEPKSRIAKRLIRCLSPAGFLILIYFGDSESRLDLNFLFRQTVEHKNDCAALPLSHCECADTAGANSLRLLVVPRGIHVPLPERARARPSRSRRSLGRTGEVPSGY